MLVPASGKVAFRHELARIAVEESLPPNVRLALHGKALAALESRPDAAPDNARLAHHAEAAGDTEAVLRFAPEAAAARGFGRGASRGRRPVRAGAPVRRKASHPRRGRSSSIDARASAARSASSRRRSTCTAQALECHRQVGDALQGGRLAACAVVAALGYRPGGRGAGRCRSAVAVLEQLPPGRELARAYDALCSLVRAACDLDGAIAWGTRSLELAQRAR